MSMPAIPRLDLAMLLFLGAVCQAVYFVAVPLTFECDAASYYSFAQSILRRGGSYSHYRAPGYPLVLALSGAVWPGTFIPLLLLQALLGAAMPAIFYRCLYGMSRRAALAGALMLIASAIPFTAAKLILTEQLYTALVLLAVMCLAQYHDRGDPRWAYRFALVALAALFVRWEAQFLVGFGLLGLMAMSLGRPRRLRYAVLAAGFVALCLVGYSAARAVFIDPALFGSLQNSSGAQMFWRMYSLGDLPFPGAEQHPRPGPAGAEDAARFPQLVRTSNGPATQRLRDIVAAYARKNPDTYRGMKDQLARLPEDKDGPTGWIYEYSFGRFDGDPEALADNIFSAPFFLATEPYVYYVTGIARSELGIVEADRLLRDVAIEAVRAHPKSLLTMFVDLPFQITGTMLQIVEQAARDPLNPAAWAELPHYRGRLTYVDVPFDAGGCASSILPQRMMAEYRFDRDSRHAGFADAAIAVASFGRNVLRPIVGLTFVFGWWAALFAPRRAFNLAVLAT
ncbi:MAG: ArnT family glycosyltransferase, partial [Rhodospirillales bacterium]